MKIGEFFVAPGDDDDEDSRTVHVRIDYNFVRLIVTSGFVQTTFLLGVDHARKLAGLLVQGAAALDPDGASPAPPAAEEEEDDDEANEPDVPDLSRPPRDDPGPG